MRNKMPLLRKGDAGIIGISENEAALKRWMVSGPEIGRMLTEYEVKCTKKRINSDLHHEQIPSTQKLFFFPYKEPG